jgi:hypothetical protein
MALLDRVPAWSRFAGDLSPLELCVQTAYTGQSIEFAFGPKGRFWPKVVYTPEHNLRFESPRWAAPAILAGAAILGGAQFYNSFLDIELKQLEIQKIHRELEGTKEPISPNAARALQLADQLRQVNPAEIIGDPDVQLWVTNVRRGMTEPNIHVAMLNGVPGPAPVPVPRAPPPPPQRNL